MATITGITAERMQAYMDENVTGGFVNEMGNLILVTRNGAQIDAGSSIPTVPLASDIAPGRVELATFEETISGTDTERAVTPAAFAAGISALSGYKLLQTVQFTASGTFTKASYPGLKAVRVRVQAGGGAGGSAQPSATAGNHSTASGGGGGGYAEKLVLAASLATSETVTVGAGGVGNTLAGLANSGGNSSFGTHAVASGGTGGNTASNQSLYVSAIGGAGGIGTTGDILVKGSAGGNGTGYATLGTGGTGGGSALGGGAAGVFSAAGGASVSGLAGGNYGGGGGGGSSNSGNSVSSAGGSGAAGIVIVEVYV